MKQLMWKMNDARNIFGQVTVKFLNIRTPEKKKCCNNPRIFTMWLYYRVMRPKDAD